ncbi:ATP synthase F1 subunit epsilon [Candidatus Nomurabacteria bacterium RIFCSPHIGHO2_02_FULL_33_12]|nr:MAG: ATP synthase F1 subunit epsilon [Candidatus Nomurabacteria bacterium RIFCSPHIGHO2_02_FULL_33_12]
MSKKLELKIVTPEKLILQEMVDQVTLPTTEGELTILPEHIPLIASLASGDVVAMTDDEYVPMAVSGGFVEVKNVAGQTQVAILADFAEHVVDITDDEIAKAKSKAEELRVLAEDKGTVDYEHFAAELERSLTRVKIADKWKSKKYRK